MTAVASGQLKQDEYAVVLSSSRNVVARLMAGALAGASSTPGLQQQSVKTLTALLRSDEPGTASAAATALGNIASRATGMLVVCSAVRWLGTDRACYCAVDSVLSSLSTPEVVWSLVDALQHDNEGCVAGACQAIAAVMRSGAFAAVWAGMSLT